MWLSDLPALVAVCRGGAILAIADIGSLGRRALETKFLYRNLRDICPGPPGREQLRWMKAAIQSLSISISEEASVCYFVSGFPSLLGGL